MKYLKFKDAQFARASAAWCPVTGKSVKPYEPRIVPNFILEPVTDPVVYYRFGASQGFTAYNRDPGCYHVTGETTDYLSDWMEQLEDCNPNIERLNLGHSYEERDIEAFRLGPANRQHFVIDCVIHGNESDGLPGTLKAFEILATHPDFARLRDEYTLFLLPCCNPDGFYFGTRDTRKLGPHPSGVDQYINLNRVWPWFWDEFVPTANESKGAVPLDCPEAQAMYLWRTEGNAGQPTPIRFIMDQHSTAGDGARYQSRDRNFKEISEYDWFTAWADYIIYRHLKATQTKRVWEDDMPDLFVNYFRSRFVPHWHTWNANRLRTENGGVSIISMVNEYNKVAYVTVHTDPETYQSACNYTLDYALCCAQVMQSGFYDARDAVLIEDNAAAPSTNSFLNPAFIQWQEKATDLDPVMYRPGYWSTGRCEFLTSSREERHMDYQGRPITIDPHLKMEVPLDTTVGPTDNHDTQVDSVTFLITWLASVIDTGGFCISRWNPAESLVEGGRDLVSDNTQQLRFAGVSRTTTVDAKYVLLGTASVGISLVYFLSGIRTVPTTYASARMNAATAWDEDNQILYVLGGETSVGVYTRTVLMVDTSSTGTIAELDTNLLDTADSGGEAIFCSGGSLDGLIVMVGGKATDASHLRVVVVDPSGSPSSDEYLLDVTDTTLPYRLISCALNYDGEGTIWIYGGEDPVTGDVHQGVWTLTWDHPDWVITDIQLLADPGDDGDPEDYGGISYWSRRWSRWRAAQVYNADDGNIDVFLLGGVEQDANTGLLLPGPYQECFLHRLVDNTLTRPEDQNYSYARTNVHYDIFGYDKAVTSWSVKASEDTNTGYIRINNAAGSAALAEMTTRRTRSFYMHPPRWWWREHACIDLIAGDPRDEEDEWRAYLRVYQENQVVSADAPMLQLGTLWPYSWMPSGLMRGTESIQWNECVDPRWMRVSLAFQPQASYLCLGSDKTLVTVICAGPSTATLTLSFIAGDTVARTYVRDQVHNVVDPVLRLTSYDTGKGTQTCDVILHWGGYAKDTARARFDTPVTIDLWQHAFYGCGIVVNNAGAIGKAFIPGSLDKSLWTPPGFLTIQGGGWWAEPKVYELTDQWVREFAAKQEPTRALVLGDRDPTWGQVSQRSTYKYVEDFHRANSTNLGDFWDVIEQTGNGWDIYSNQARCNGLGWERWDAYAYIRDTAILGDVRVSHTSGRVGFFSRMHYGQAGGGYIFGYLGSLYVSSGGTATLEIELFDATGYVQARSTLVTTACPYTLSDVLELEFETVGSTLTLTARSGETVVATVTTTDITYPMPGAFGICGETTGSTRYVYLDDVYAEPRGTNKIRITD